MPAFEFVQHIHYLVLGTSVASHMTSVISGAATTVAGEVQSGSTLSSEDGMPCTPIATLHEERPRIAPTWKEKYTWYDRKPLNLHDMYSKIVEGVC